MIELRRATPADAQAVADVYLASFRHALPTVRLAHNDESIRAWVRSRLVPETECWVALDAGAVVGMMSLSRGWVDQLYVTPDRLGEGIGRRLLELAQSRADDELQLWTFQVNDGARRFYERNGFSAVEFTNGLTNQEHEPDVRFVWRRLSSP